MLIKSGPSGRFFVVRVLILNTGIHQMILKKTFKCPDSKALVHLDFRR